MELDHLRWDRRCCAVRSGSPIWTRPAVANLTAARLGRGVVTVVPVTSNTDRVFPFQTLLPAAGTGLRYDAKAPAEQIRSIAVERLGAVLGRVPSDVMGELDDALRLHLQL